MRLARRMTAVLAAALLGVAGCAGSSPDASSGSSSAASDDGALTGTLTVYAAASLTDAFGELGDRLMAGNPGLDVRFNFAGSSALATQLTQGAPADVFASADGAQMARAQDAEVVADPTVFAQNPLMLAVPRDNPAGVTPPQEAGIPSLADLVPADLVLAVCAPEVPCGVSAAEVLDAAGLADVPDTYEDDVRAVLTKVQFGEVDAGLVYVSDVHSAGDTVHAFAFRESALAVNRYPVSVVADAPNPAAAQAFVDLVLSATGRQVLRDAGFQEP